MVVEDDHHISDLVALYLRRDGFRVLQASDGEGGLAIVGRERPRLVIVDVGLPGRDRRLRGLPASPRVGDVPVVMLTARDDEVDRVLGLELGADDYVTKPFSARELVARVHAILRRTERGRRPRRPAVSTVGPVEVDTGRREVRGPDGPVALTTREFDLLAYLAANQGLALSAPAPRRCLGRGLVRRRADRRRPRPPAPQEARRRPAPGHRLGRRVPARLSGRTGARRGSRRPFCCWWSEPWCSPRLGSYVLVRRAAHSTAEQQLYSAGPGARRPRRRPRPGVPQPRLLGRSCVKFLGQYSASTVVGLSAGGQLHGDLPDHLGVPVAPARRPPRRLVGGREHVAARLRPHPPELTTAQKARLTRPIPYQDDRVLVATRTVQPPVNGLAYFVLVGLVVLVDRHRRRLLPGAALLAPVPRRGRDAPVASPAATSARGCRCRRRTCPSSARWPRRSTPWPTSLERARRQQRQFLLSISHDLRTPLTSIRGYAEAVAEGATDDVQGAIAVIIGEATRLERLVRDLLDLARLDADRFSLHLGRGRRVGTSSGGRSRASARRWPAPGSSVQTRARRAPMWVLTDPDRLAQVLANLRRERLPVRPPPDRRRRRARTAARCCSGWRRRSGDRPRGPAPGVRAALHRRPGRRRGGRDRAGPGHRGRAGGRHGRRRPGRVAHHRCDGGTRLTVWLPAAPAELPVGA